MGQQSPPSVPGKVIGPRIGVYTGTGSSHSWLWFMTLFEKLGWHDVRCLDEDALSLGRLDGCEVLAVSGGDTFAIAEALGPVGAQTIRTFIENGGLYLGACAGAYLAMNSSKAPLNLFNWAPVKIANLSRLRPPVAGGPMAEKFAMAYGSDFVFHPVRDAVQLALDTSGCNAGPVAAPMFGGPAMVAGPPVRIMARYSGFTPKTIFLSPRPLAEDTLIDKAAIVTTSLGKGKLFLCGPHLEHPRFPEANALVAEIIAGQNRPRQVAGCGVAKGGKRHHPKGGGPLHDLRRHLSNARIAAAGLEWAPVSWLIGRKVYEPAHLREFIETLWARITRLQQLGLTRDQVPAAGLLATGAETVVGLLRGLKSTLDADGDGRMIAGQAVAGLRRLAMDFFNLYFLVLADGSAVPENS